MRMSSGATAHRTLQLLADMVGSPVATPEGMTGVVTVDAVWNGAEFHATAEGQRLSVGLAISSSIALCLGDCDYPFIERASSHSGVATYRSDPLVFPRSLDPGPWLSSRAGSDWLGAMPALRQRESLLITSGWAEIRLVCTIPERDFDRAQQLLAMTVRVPRAELDAVPARRPPDTLGLDPSLSDVLMRYSELLDSDDVVRGARLREADRPTLLALVAEGGPLLSAINEVLDKLDEKPSLTPPEAELMVRLHQLAQAVLEADQT